MVAVMGIHINLLVIVVAFLILSVMVAPLWFLDRLRWVPRSLKLSLQTKSGPVSLPTQRAVEDAILTRARQLRKEASRY